MAPRNFEMLWTKAMCERFLRLPDQADSFAAAAKAGPGKYAKRMEHIRAIEAYGPLEIQSAFERILLIGNAADEGDVDRAKRLLALSQAEIALPGAWADFRDSMEQRIKKAERRRGGRPAPQPVRRRPRLRARTSSGEARQGHPPPPEAP